MSNVSEFDWQPLTTLRPLLLAVEGMLEVAVVQLQDFLQAKKSGLPLEGQMLKRMTNACTQYCSHIGLYKLQCQRWKTESLTRQQSECVEKLEAAVTELEKVNQQVLLLVRRH